MSGFTTKPNCSSSPTVGPTEKDLRSLWALIPTVGTASNSDAKHITVAANHYRLSNPAKQQLIPTVGTAMLEAPPNECAIKSQIIKCVTVTTYRYRFCSSFERAPSAGAFPTFYKLRMTDCMCWIAFCGNRAVSYSVWALFSYVCTAAESCGLR
jgi:hypothetical protein